MELSSGRSFDCFSSKYDSRNSQFVDHDIVFPTTCDHNVHDLTQSPTHLPIHLITHSLTTHACTHHTSSSSHLPSESRCVGTQSTIPGPQSTTDSFWSKKSKNKKQKQATRANHVLVTPMYGRGKVRFFHWCRNLECADKSPACSFHGSCRLVLRGLPSGLVPVLLQFHATIYCNRHKTNLGGLVWSAAIVE